MDQVDKIMAFEQGDLDDDGVIELFQELIMLRHFQLYRKLVFLFYLIHSMPKRQKSLNLLNPIL